jgi:hypothetical protein
MDESEKVKSMERENVRQEKEKGRRLHCLKKRKKRIILKDLV